MTAGSIKYEFLAIIVAVVAMSALGHKRTYAVQKGMSAFPTKADIKGNIVT